MQLWFQPCLLIGIQLLTPGKSEHTNAISCLDFMHFSQIVWTGRQGQGIVSSAKLCAASFEERTSVFFSCAAQALSTAVAVIPPDLEDEYRIEWLSDGEPAVLKRWELARKRVPLTRAVLKSWLPLAAEAENVTVGTLFSAHKHLAADPTRGRLHAIHCCIYCWVGSMNDQRCT